MPMVSQLFLFVQHSPLNEYHNPIMRLRSLEPSTAGRRMTINLADMLRTSHGEPDNKNADRSNSAAFLLRTHLGRSGM